MEGCARMCTTQVHDHRWTALTSVINLTQEGENEAIAPFEAKIDWD